MRELSVLLAFSSEDGGGLARVARTLAARLPRHGIRVTLAAQREGRSSASGGDTAVATHIVPQLIETLDRTRDGRASLSAVAGNLASLRSGVRPLRTLARHHEADVLYSHGS